MQGAASSSKEFSAGGEGGFAVDAAGADADAERVVDRSRLLHQIGDDGFHGRRLVQRRRHHRLSRRHRRLDRIDEVLETSFAVGPAGGQTPAGRRGRQEGGAAPVITPAYVLELRGNEGEKKKYMTRRKKEKDTKEEK